MTRTHRGQDGAPTWDDSHMVPADRMPAPSPLRGLTFARARASLLGSRSNLGHFLDNACSSAPPISMYFSVYASGNIF